MSIDVITNSSVNCSLESAKTMWEFLQPVVIAIVAGASALGGAYLGPFMQRNERQKEIDRADSAIIRDKAEEVFQELDRFLNDSRAASSGAMQWFQSDTYDPPNDLKRPADLERLQALIATYFPNAIPILDVFDDEVQSLANEFSKQMKIEMSKGGPSPDALKGYNAFFASSRATVDANMVKNLRQFMIGHVKKYAPNPKPNSPPSPQL